MNDAEIFEKHPHADAYRVGGFYSPYCLASEDKRFSEAELAAEYWCEYAEHLYWAPERGRIHSKQAHLHKQSKEYADVLERFATLPHASDSDYE